MFKKFRASGSKRTAFIAGLVVAVASVLGLAVGGVNQVSAASGNDIMYGGCSTPSNCISKIKANNDNGHHDLKNIYNFYHLPAADYDNFAAHAVKGNAYRNGEVKVGNMLVARNGKSIGRFASSQGSGYFTQTINGINYYGNTNDKNFASDPIPVYILFDKSGTMQFAIMPICGNVEFGNNVPTSASCQALTQTPIAGKANSYNFTASANKQGNATIVKYIYNFGDGSPTVTQTNGATPVPHTYTKEGTFTASVTVIASVPGNPNLTLPVVAMCTKQIKVVLPAFSCMQLTGAFLDQEKMKVSFTATAKFSGGATFNSADFTFGDGSSQTGVKPNSDGKTATATHDYAAPGTYNANAILHFTVDGKSVIAEGCPAVVTPTKPPTPECKPGVPVGSPECTPCQFDSSLPSNSPECTPPPLPNTGAGNTIAIFAAVVIGGFLVYRQLLFRKHKAAFAAAQQGTSPLPLADPLNDETPLAGTPLAPAPAKRFSFRRKRHF